MRLYRMDIKSLVFSKVNEGGHVRMHDIDQDVILIW